MFQRRQARILIGVLLAVSLVLITLDVRGGEGNLLERVRGTATAVFAPIQEGMSAAVRPLGDLTGRTRELFRIRSENAELRAQVERLSERHRLLTDLERENEELRDLLEIRDRADLEVVTARAVALAPSTFEWTITIDVGSNDGVERDMPVIGGQGLVGRVIQVTPGASRVLLAIDPSFSATSRIGHNGEIGTVSGRGGDPLQFQPIDPASQIEVGDELVTSSYAGGVFPAGLPIGVVTDAGDDQARLIRTVEVLPYVDFTRLHHVHVVLNAPIEPVPPLEGTADIPFVPPQIDRDRDPDSLEEVDPLDATDDEDLDSDPLGEEDEDAPP